MDNLLVGDELPNGGGQETAPLSYTDIFNKHFPYFLSIGMTPEQYWDGDCTLVKYYKEADNMRFERENTLAWLHGMYIYEALCDVAPVLMFSAKRGATVEKYSSEPYSFGKNAKEREQERKNEEKKAKAMAYMKAFMTQHNKKRKEDNKDGE